MRLWFSIFLSFAAFSAVASDDAGSTKKGDKTWPLWDGQESVERYAKRVGLPPTETLDLGNGVKLEMVLIPAGQFTMGTQIPIQPCSPAETVVVGQTIFVGGIALGLVFIVSALLGRWKKRFILAKSPSGENHERSGKAARFAAFQISLARLIMTALAFSGATYGATRWQKANLAWKAYVRQKQEYTMALGSWKREIDRDDLPAHSVTITKPFYMGQYETTQAQYKALTGENPSRFKNDNNPVEQVSWVDARQYCDQLATKLSRPMRLPNEAEWEFACRAGTSTSYYFGEDIDTNKVNYDAGLTSKGKTMAVGTFPPNRFGLYDMHGNVEEWCSDWYDAIYYMRSPSSDPQGPPTGGYRIVRGGSWYSKPWSCRSAFRTGQDAAVRHAAFGFRIVYTPELP